MVHPKQKLIASTPKKRERNVSIPLKKVIKSQRRQEKIGAEKHYKTARKQRISTYVSIITLNVHELILQLKDMRNFSGG